MPLAPKLTAAQATAALADITPPYSAQEAKIEANRCLFCFDAPCIMSCPTGIDIPSFIRKIANDIPSAAARVILEANILGASCARVCPTSVLCEGACVVLDREGDPVKIGRLQRYATDYIAERNISVLPKPAATSGKKVAVLGSGPAGLGCAAELARLGHTVTVFEKKPRGGGLNTYGIAYYKMKPEVSLKEVELVESLGVSIRYNTEVGRDVTAEQLAAEYDAVFLGIGLGAGKKLGIPGEDLPGVVDAIDFIEQIHAKPLHQVPVGDQVIVIGCGNTAIDASTQAKLLGASHVTIVYRRGEGDMSAYDFEYELAKADGVEFIFHAATVEAKGDAKSGVTALVIKLADGSEKTIACDMIIKAVGQEKAGALAKALFPELETDKVGRVVHDADTFQTSIPHLFAGGDCANGGREVVNAVGEGKKAARGIHAFLAGTPAVGPVQASRLGIKSGPPAGSGLDHPIRVRELEAAAKS